MNQNEKYELEGDGKMPTKNCSKYRNSFTAKWVSFQFWFSCLVHFARSHTFFFNFFYYSIRHYSLITSFFNAIWNGECAHVCVYLLFDSIGSGRCEARLNFYECYCSILALFFSYWFFHEPQHQLLFALMW